MLKSPKKTKYQSPYLRRTEKGLKGVKLRQEGIIIKSKQPYLLSPQQREVTRRIFAKSVREHYGYLDIRFFPYHSLTKKPLQMRMGKGKGKHAKWVAPIKKGNTVLKITGKYKLKLIRRLNKKLKHKLPIDLKIIYPKNNTIFIKDDTNLSRG